MYRVASCVGSLTFGDGTRCVLFLLKERHSTVSPVLHLTPSETPHCSPHCLEFTKHGSPFFPSQANDCSGQTKWDLESQGIEKGEMSS